MTAIRSYEESLSLELLRILRECAATIYGVREDHRVHERVPTLCFNLRKISPARVTETMADAGIGIRDGHMYTPRLMKRFGLRQDSGVVRISAVHYNTMEEIHRFGEARDGKRGTEKEANPAPAQHAGHWRGDWCRAFFGEQRDDPPGGAGR